MLVVEIDEKKVKNWNNLGKAIQEQYRYSHSNEPGIISVKNSDLTTDFEITQLVPLGTVIIKSKKISLASWNQKTFTAEWRSEHNALELVME